MEGGGLLGRWKRKGRGEEGDKKEKGGAYDQSTLYSWMGME
jgi:hypothetical protein